MGFYGNVSNTNRTTFVFDRIYPNRKAMDSNISIDGVFIGRYVLVEYDRSAETYFQRLFTVDVNGEEWFCFDGDNLDTRAKYEDVKSNALHCIAKNEIIYITDANDANGAKVFYKCSGNADGFAVFTKIKSQTEGQTTNESNYYDNYLIDSYTYPDAKRGYDGTVWQKVYSDGGEKYVMIAELNSVVPTFKIAIDPPTEEPGNPHFDQVSTDVYYRLHMQPQWGFRVKPSTGKYNTDGKAIYYNLEGFSPEERSYIEDLENEISLKPTGKSDYSKNTGYNADDPLNPFATIKGIEDIQELSILLPSLGNAVSDMWDVVYGDGEYVLDDEGKILIDENTQQPIISYKNKRNLDTKWDSPLGLRLVQQNENGFTFDTVKAQSLAGCINSVHDLMGMIIKTNGEINSELIDDASMSNIYYGNVDGKVVNGNLYNSFYIKNPVYKYTESTEPSIVAIDKEKLRDFKDEKYYQFDTNNNNYYLEKNGYTFGNNYYQLINVEKKTLVDGYVPNKYYYHPTLEDDNGNIIISKNYELFSEEDPVEEIEYFEIITDNITQVTFPNAAKKVLFFQAKDHLPAEETGGIAQGYFYRKTIKYKDEAETIVVDDYRPITSKSVFIPSTVENEDSIITTDYYYIVGYSIETQPGAEDPENPEQDQKVYIIPESEDAKIQVEFINFEENKYYFKDENNVYYLLENKESINDNVIYYVMEKEGNQAIRAIEYPFYDANKYYYLNDDNYIFGTEATLQDKQYYKILEVEDTEKEGIIFYEPNKYYYKNEDGNYVIDINTFLDPNKEYFKIFDLYVVFDEHHIFERGAKWNPNIKEIPDGVTTGIRDTVYEWRELTGFSKNLNTIHGLILEINRLLQFHDLETRDRETVQGCINIMNDIIDKIDTLIPKQFLSVDEYGRIKSFPYTTDQIYETYSTDDICINLNGEQKIPAAVLNSDTKEALENEISVIKTIYLIEKENILSQQLNTELSEEEQAVLDQQLKDLENKYELDIDSVEKRLELIDGTQEKNWIDINIVDNFENPLIQFKHNYYPIDGVVNYEDLNEATKEKDNIYLYRPTIDNAGHIIAHNYRDTILPYGYKKFETVGLSSTDDSDLYTSIKYSDDGSVETTSISTESAGVVVANNTQDNMYINPVNKWIQIQLKEEEESDDNSQSVLTIAHEIHAIPTNSFGTSNMNSEDGANDENNINIPDWNYDKAGHIIEKHDHYYTLPFGYKTIKTNGRGNSEEKNATSNPEISDIVADSTQDVLTINSGNKWVRIDSDSDNDTITISHDIHEIDTEKIEQPTDLNDGTDTITIQDINFDTAGHVISNKNHTYTLPFGYKSFKDSEENPGQTDAETTQSIMTLIGDDWIKPIVSAQDTLKYEHIGPVESNEVKSEDADKTPQFGETFTIEDWYFDDKGHKSNRLTHTVTIPKGSLTDNDKSGSDIITQLSFEESTGALSTTRENLSSIKLAGYNKGTDNNDIAAEDTLGQALSKLQVQIIEEETARDAIIDALDMSDESDTLFISKITQTNGKVAVERAAAGTLVLSDSTENIATQNALRIVGNDSIETAFGKVEAQIAKENTDRVAAINSINDALKLLNGKSTEQGSVAYQIAEIVNDNNNGSIDTLNEIAAWIINDTTGAAKMNADIGTNTTNIALNAAAIELLETSTVSIATYEAKIAELEQEILTVNSRCNVLDKEVKNLINKVTELEAKLNS